MSRLGSETGKLVSENLIPIAAPVFSEEEIEEVVKVLRSGQVRQGTKVEEFEQNFCQEVGCKYAYAVSSGTAALHTAYLSVLNQGDEVIVPNLTFIATASTVVFASGRPVFADIDKETFTIDPEDVERKITPKTKAIAPVHLFGNAADMKALGEIASHYGLLLISDAAQAHKTMLDGKDIGTFDDLNCYSFYPTKNMTTGEGGMVMTNNRELWERGELIRSHGQSSKYYHTILGLNYRMTEIAAVIGIKQLEKLEKNIEERRKNAEFLTRELEEIEGIQAPIIRNGVRHSFHQYSILLDLSRFKCSRDEFVEALNIENIGCAVHYPIPLTKQPVFQDSTNHCPVSEDVATRIFSLPVHPALNQDDLEKIMAGMKKVAKCYNR